MQTLSDRILLDIQTAMNAKKMDRRMVAKKSGMPYQTLCRRFREPGKMTVEELEDISRAVGIKWGSR